MFPSLNCCTIKCAFTLHSPLYIYTTIMKTVTLAGLIILLITFLAVSELNWSLSTQQELVSESVIELENSENEFDCAVAFLTKKIPLLSVEPKNLHDYKSDSILFDISEDLFRPPSLA